LFSVVSLPAMAENIKEIFKFRDFSLENIMCLLRSEGKERGLLFQEAAGIKKIMVEDKVYFRGLVEFSNICTKNCLYCGIRKSNKSVKRYNLNDEEILDSIRYAYDHNFGSVVLQSGERDDKTFVERVDSLLKKIQKLSNGNLRVTLSTGEQSRETYQRWFESGAQRYLLRIESSNADLFEKIHPEDDRHSFERRLQSLIDLKDIGYQTGTGVMIGMPFQTLEDLARDLIFMKEFEIDMVGMGPYIEHKNTPLYQYKDELLPLQVRFDLALKMIAILRLMMPDINIAAATALQAIDKIGREKAIKAGANVIMPNITPGTYRDDYALYENKPCTDENPEDCSGCLETRIYMTDHEVAFGEWGDSAHYSNRMKSKP
jgi:biotin synthase